MQDKISVDFSGIGYEDASKEFKKTLWRNQFGGIYKAALEENSVYVEFKPPQEVVDSLEAGKIVYVLPIVGEDETNIKIIQGEKNSLPRALTPLCMARKCLSNI